MTKAPAHTITDEAITIVWMGKPIVVKKGAPNFHNLRSAIKTASTTGEWDKIGDHLTTAGTVRGWSNDKFDLTENSVTFCGQPVPEAIRRRVLNLSAEGKSPNPVLRFYERLQRNPSKRSVDQLFPFLEKMNIPVSNDGCFLAYKGVNNDFTDSHSRTISNKPGTTVKLPRNLVSDDPREACHFGLHVGAVGYAKSFADRTVICKVDPEHVVCVPYDHSQEKMRVCEYKVIGNYGDDLPDDFIENEALETAHDEKAVEVTEEEIDNTAQLEKGKAKSKKKEQDDATDKTVKTKRIEKKLDKKEFAKYSKLKTKDLMEFSIEELRRYATYGLELVGASKIAGGKSALVSKILKHRDK